MDTGFDFDDIHTSAPLPPLVAGQIARMTATIARLQAEKAATVNPIRIGKLSHQISAAERQRKKLLAQFGPMRRKAPAPR